MYKKMRNIWSYAKNKSKASLAEYVYINLRFILNYETWECDMTVIHVGV